MSEYFGTLTKRSDHPASPNQLTRCGPLTTVILSKASIKQAPHRTHLKFESRPRKLLSRNLQSFALPDEIDSVAAILREISEGTSY